MKISYLPQAKIDKQKWDACINAATNGLIYAYSFYLDAMCNNWNALLVGDYEIVMPLTWKKKYGIEYLYQPPFTQQLGIFSYEKVTEEIKNAFINELQKKFRFAEIFVNFYTYKEKANFILPLNKTYDELRNSYKKTTIKSLKYASKFSLFYKKEDDIDEAIDLYKSHYSNRIPHVTKKDYEQFKSLCFTAKNNDALLIRKVSDGKDNVMAVALLLKDHRRLYNIISTVTNSGRNCEANYFLYDNLIQEFSHKDIILDFEGSSITSIATFYQKFGAISQPYFFLRFNNLPFPLNYFK